MPKKTAPTRQPEPKRDLTTAELEKLAGHVFDSMPFAVLTPTTAARLKILVAHRLGREALASRGKAKKTAGPQDVAGELFALLARLAWDLESVGWALDNEDIEYQAAVDLVKRRVDDARDAASAALLKHYKALGQERPELPWLGKAVEGVA